MKMVAETRMVAEEISAYTYGTSQVAKSPVSLNELEQLKQTVGVTREDRKV